VPGVVRVVVTPTGIVIPNVSDHCHAERSEASPQFAVMNRKGYHPELIERAE
jgi:hypothetical protein